MKNTDSLATTPQNDPSLSFTKVNDNQSLTESEQKADLLKILADCPNGFVVRKLDEKGREYNGFYRSENMAVVTSVSIIEPIASLLS